jgi:hypothetical protein
MADELLPDPGVMASDGQLPQDGGDSESDTPFLVTSPTIQPLPDIMDDTSSDDSSGDSALTGIPATSSSSAPSALDTSLLGFGENLGSSLFGAFVTGPQNAATAEGVANNAAANALSSTGQLFSYLIIGLVIFLIVGAAEK